MQSTADGAANAANCPGPGCRLRDALAAANSGDTINFSVTGTITLNSGELSIARNLTITGPGAPSLTIDGNASTRVFYIAPNLGVSISGLTIANGKTGFGGALYNDHSNVALALSVVRNNSGAYGGAIYNDGSTDGGTGVATFTLSNSTVSSNTASNGGGAIFNYAQNTGSGGTTSVTLTILNSTLNNNVAGNGGGGIANYGVFPGANGLVNITNSTLSANSASAGGGIYNIGDLGNATVTINNSTLSGNTASTAGGAVYTIIDAGDPGIAALNTANTIYNAGASGGTITSSGGSVNSSGYNLASDNANNNLSGTGDIINTNPQLGPLQNNGGPTATHALGTNSPAREAGNPSFDPNAFNPPLINDQRGSGFPRVLNRLDIGAYELPAPLTLVHASSFANHIALPSTVLPFEINLPLSGSPGVECRSDDGNGANLHNIFFYFPNQITTTANATVSCGTVTSRGTSGNPISVEFSGAACDQKYVTITLSGIQDSYGQTLASASVMVGLLLGDVNGDRFVNAADATVTRNRSGQTADATNFRADANVDATINAADATTVRARSGNSLPAGVQQFTRTESDSRLPAEHRP
ncbi:MAG: choice-of-anchor Q domain-containing protein [Chthoniobacterales bacterium]